MATAAPTMYKMERADKDRQTLGTVGSGPQPSRSRQTEQTLQSPGQRETSSQSKRLLPMSSWAKEQLQPAFNEKEASSSVLFSQESARSQSHKFSYESHWNRKKQSHKNNKMRTYYWVRAGLPVHFALTDKLTS